MTKKPEHDLAPEAVAARLETVRELYRLGMSLKRAGRALRVRSESAVSTDREKRGS
jgi:hypothetical protein